ncbi:hypothetical protein PGB90_003474 [Kerria lacca]
MSNDYSSLKVVDLKKELKTRGLSTTGNKDELVERLNTYTQNLLGSGSDIDGFGESITENDILDEDVLGEELDYEEELKKSADLGFSSPNENHSLDLPADISVDSNNSGLNVTVIAANEEKPLPQRETRQKSQKSEKKVHLIRNRSLSLFSDADLKENNKRENTEDKNKQIKPSEPTEIIKTKLSQPMKERLEQRKRKFGLVQEEDRKAARAARFGITNNSDTKAFSKTTTESLDVLKQRAERFGLSSSAPVSMNKTLQTLKSRAERFGAVVSPLLNKLSEEEKMQTRKNRFLLSTTSSIGHSSLEEKKKLRAQRFNIIT